MRSFTNQRQCTSQARSTSHAHHSLMKVSLPLPASPVPTRTHQQQHHCVVVASSGFGKTKQKQASSSKKPTQQPRVAAPSPSSTGTKGQPVLLQGTASATDLASGLWNDVLDDVEEFFTTAQREVKAVTLAAGRTLVLYRHNGTVYCSDVNSTAYQFPLVDAKIIIRDQAPAVQVPLEGTVYDLRTGQVLEWCPRTDDAVKNFFATLRRNTPPVPLAVYPTQVTSAGKLRVRLTPLQ